MTLKELLDLKLVRGNARILVFKGDSNGLGQFTEEFEVKRTFGVCLSKEALLESGMKIEHLDYKVNELWGDRFKNKIAIVIEKK